MSVCKAENAAGPAPGKDDNAADGHFRRQTFCILLWNCCNIRVKKTMPEKRLTLSSAWLLIVMNQNVWAYFSAPPSSLMMIALLMGLLYSS